MNSIALRKMYRLVQKKVKSDQIKENGSPELMD